MAKRLIWTQAAWSDLEAAADYIANDSPVYARSFVAEIKQAASSLTSLSERGRIVPEIAKPDTREIFPAGYRLIYRISDDSITILGLIHHARDWSNISREF